MNNSQATINKKRNALICLIFERPVKFERKAGDMYRKLEKVKDKHLAIM
jgi:hypothetical protein